MVDRSLEVHSSLSSSAAAFFFRVQYSKIDNFSPTPAWTLLVGVNQTTTEQAS